MSSAVDLPDLQSFGYSHEGAVRKINEDSILLRPDLGLWLVADGLGGHSAGDVASKMVADSCQKVVSHNCLSAFVDEVDAALIRANKLIRQHSVQNCDGRLMGATVISLIVREYAAVCLWAGDSRLYRLRYGQLQCITRDHSQVAELVDQGRLTEEEALNHPQSHVITRAIGAEEKLCVEAKVIDVQAGDTFLLCSDGLYNEVLEKDFPQYLGYPDANQGVQGLMRAALNSGARDNVSAIVVRF